MPWGTRLDEEPLLAPCCYHMPSNFVPEKLYEWFFSLEVNLITEIFTLSSKSVLYEMAQHCLQHPKRRHPANLDGKGLAALMRHFSESLRRFEHHGLIYECRMLFLNHFQAGLSCIRFQPALERLLPSEAMSSDTHDLVQSASRSGSLLSSDGPMQYCVAEELGEEKWLFRDVDEGDIQGEGIHHSPGESSNNSAPRLLLGADAKLAHSVTLFVWAAVGLLARRIEMLQEFPRDHPLFAPAPELDTVKVSFLGDSFETLMLKRKSVAQAGKKFMRQGKWQEAVDEFSHSMAMPPDEDEGKYPVYTFRGGCYLQLLQYHEAVEDCTQALRFNPNGYLALLLRARAYEAMGQLDSAVGDITLLRRLYPDSSEVQEFHTRLAKAQSAAEPQQQCPKTGTQSIEGIAGAASLFLCGSPNSGGGVDSIGSPSFGTISFASSQLGFNLADLPAHPEPLNVEDPPFLSALMERETDLEYSMCCGKELGRGTYGRVYRAVHSAGGWFLAVKEVEAKEAEGYEDLLPAFERIVTMKHNNVVRCLKMRRLPDSYHLVMEFCSGGSLRSLVEELQGLSPSLMRKYATEVLRGLRYMHGQRLLHRNIKASNVLLRDDGTAKIADFGACMIIPEAEPDRSLCGPVKGTVLWMAPETFRERYSTASDVWSFGCMLIEMATAKDPWHEQQFQEQLTAMVFIATRPDALPAIPPQLNDHDLGRHFFHCCIARDPSERCSADLLLRHPWLSSVESSTSVTPHSPNVTSIQDSFRDGADDCSHGFQWTTCSSVTDSAFTATMTRTNLYAEPLSSEEGLVWTTSK